ncbi:hypothetical protein FACS1894104_4550 [Actinomycetota bacterium]|nr:hypothetical protein FACS1894104_4550 [Actinomycetota bacterium]
MRTTDNATSNVASGETPDQIFYDALFRNSKGKVIDPPALPTNAQIADTHAHLDMLHNPELALARAAAHGVNFVVTVIDPTENPSYTFENLDSWIADAGELLDKWFVGQRGRGTCPTNPSGTGAPSPLSQDSLPKVRIIIGCHPHNASKYDQNIQRIITDAVQNDSRVVGIGEIGLDYHYDNSPRDVQRQVFRQQVQLAHQLNVPMQGSMCFCESVNLAVLAPASLAPCSTKSSRASQVCLRGEPQINSISGCFGIWLL